MSGGGGKSGSKSKSSARQKSFIDPDQLSYLKNLWGAAGDLWGQTPGLTSPVQQAGRWAAPYMQGIATGALPAWQQQLQGGATAPTAAAINPALQRSLEQSMTGPSSMGQMYESIVGGSGNTYIDPMVDAMEAGVQRRLERGTLPQLTQGAVGAGQMGSSRHGIAEGLARAEAQRDMMNQETMMRGGAYDKDLAMKMQIARQADLGRGQAQQRAIDLMNSQNEAQREGIGAGAGLQNLGMGTLAPGMQAGMFPWQMMGQYVNAIGRPTILGEGKQSGSSKGKGMSVGGGI